MVSKDELRKKDKEELVDMLYDLLIKFDKLTTEVVELRNEIKILKTPKNSSNSSIAPSQDLFSLKNQSLREKSGRKTGGQPGHKGNTLPMSPDPDRIIAHVPDNKCPMCGKLHPDGQAQLISRRQVIDIPLIKASVVEHQVYQTTCSCGHVASGSFPAAVTAPVQYGNNLIAFIAYLSSRQYVPYARLSELVKSVTNISLSEGTVSNLLNKAANIMVPIYNGIKEEVSKATTVGGDETGVKVKNQKSWAWTWQTLHATYIVISKTRGFATVEKEFPQGFVNATFVSDSLSAQLKTPAKWHQLCLAHLLRELNYLIEVYHHKWATDMKDLLNRAIALKNSMTNNQYRNPLEERTKILDEFETLINQQLPDTVPKILPFQKRMIKRRNEVFNFLLFPEVPFDNNGSERAIRNVKVKQKVSGSFRSERGAEIFSIIRSVVDTIIKKGGNPFDSIQFALNVATQKNEFLSSK